MSGLTPGKINGMYTTRDVPDFYKACCGGCRQMSETLHTFNLYTARQVLHDWGWVHQEGMGWICPACRQFVASVEGGK